MTIDEKPRVAVMGLGLMGAGMARNLLAAGYPVTVYNRSRSKAEALAKDGARVAGTPREAAAGAAVVISMVADDDASRSVWLGPEGALSGIAPGTVCIESGTLTVGWVRELASAVAEAGGEFLDAPVTGSRVQADEGQLLFLVGGSSETLEKVRPLLDVMGRDVIHLGPSGSGSLMKLINNFMCGVQVASLAEALGWLERSGLDRDRALAVLTEGAPGSPLVRLLAGRMVARDYTPNFALQLMAKDLRYSYAEAQNHDVTLRTAVSAREVFEAAIAEGLGDEDMSAVVEQFREMVAS